MPRMTEKEYQNIVDTCVGIAERNNDAALDQEARNREERDRQEQERIEEGNYYSGDDD